MVLIPIYGRKNHLVSKTGRFSYTNTSSMIFSPFLVPSNRLKQIPFLTVGAYIMHGTKAGTMVTPLDFIASYCQSDNTVC
jgi:hypothetical protein